MQTTLSLTLAACYLGYETQNKPLSLLLRNSRGVFTVRRPECLEQYTASAWSTVRNLINVLWTLDCQTVPRHATQTNRCPPIILLWSVIMLAVKSACTVLRAATKAQCDADVSSLKGWGNHKECKPFLRKRNLQCFLCFSFHQFNERILPWTIGKTKREKAKSKRQVIILPVIQELCFNRHESTFTLAPWGCKVGQCRIRYLRK